MAILCPAVDQPIGELCLSRRQLLAATGAACLPLQFFMAAWEEIDTQGALATPATLWDGCRQIVYAYQQGETLGEPCRLLDEAKNELPVSLRWQLPPDWVERFPTIHFQNSSGRWVLYKGWENVEDFVAAYEEFNPPAKSDRQISPYKSFVQTYDPPYWSWPGRITDHLLDPNGPHRFSQYELRGLKVSEKKRLHAAHHQGIVEPGRKPQSGEDVPLIEASDRAAVETVHPAVVY